MSSVRLRRIAADFEKLSAYVKQHPRLRLLQTVGDPPESYQIEYRLNSARQWDGQLVKAKDHVVEIALPRNYPRVPPVCRMLTPIFHPNIAPHAICVGDHWSAGEPLWQIVARIGEMIAFQSYNTKSPLNGEAARWVDDHVGRLPFDNVSMMPDEEPGPVRGVVAAGPPLDTVAAPPPVSSDVAGPGETASGSRAVTLEQRISIVCPKCERHYVVPPQAAGRQVQCKQCQTFIQVPAPPASD